MPISEVFCMDCLDYMRSIPNKYFDLAVVDPPYGINAPAMDMGSSKGNTSTATKLRKGRLNGGARKLKNRALNTMSCDWDFSPPTQEYFDELRRVSKNQIIWGGNYFPLPPTRGIICWDKRHPWENFSQVEIAWTSFDCPAKIVRISTTGGNNHEEKIHPTQKPVSLYSWIFKTFAGGGIREYLILTSVANLQGLLHIMPDLISTAARLTTAISKVAAPASIKSVAALRTSTAKKSNN